MNKILEFVEDVENSFEESLSVAISYLKQKLEERRSAKLTHETKMKLNTLFPECSAFTECIHEIRDDTSFIDNYDDISYFATVVYDENKITFSKQFNGETEHYYKMEYINMNVIDHNGKHTHFTIREEGNFIESTSKEALEIEAFTGIPFEVFVDYVRVLLACGDYECA